MDVAPVRIPRGQVADLRGWGVVGFLALNVGVRLWMLFHGGGNLVATSQNDETTYLNIAGELATQGVSWLFSPRAVQAAPAHIILLAIIGRSIVLGKLISLAASTLTLLPLISIARRVLPPRGTFWVAVAFTACLTFSGFALTILTESINTFLLTSAIALLIRAFSENGWTRWAVLSGLVLGLATIWRATTMFYPLGLGLLFLAVWLVPPLRRRAEFQVPRALKVVAFHALGLALIAAPVILKNGLAANQWKLATGQGATLYLGADQKAKGWEPFFSGYDFDTFEVSAPYSHLEPEGDALLSQAAMRQMRRDPLGTLAMRVHWPVRLFIGEPSDLFNPTHSALQSWKVLKKNTTLLTIWNLSWRALALVFSIWFFARNWRRAEGFVLMSVPLYFLIVFLPMFVISRYGVPMLPLMAVSLVGGLLATGSRLVPGAVSVAVIIAISFWYAVLPEGVDPDGYSKHTELATWPAANGTSHWSPLYGAAQRAGDSEHQRFVVAVDTPSLAADGQGVALERNQIFLLPIKLSPRRAGWALHTFWRSDRHPSFAEDNFLDVYALADERSIQLNIPAVPGDTLRGARLDLDVAEGDRVRIGSAQMVGAPASAGPWSCNMGCTQREGGDAGVVFIGGKDREALVADLTAPLDAPVSVTIPVELPAPPLPHQRFGDVIAAALRWQLEGDTNFTPGNERAFEVPVDGHVHWVHLNPSLFQGSARWDGRLRKVSLRFEHSHDVEIELGTMRLLKDYRMLRP